MAFRPRQGNYIKERNGVFYYRRAIPKKFRGFYNQSVEWVIELRGRTQREREHEAKALAHQHNMQLKGWEQHGSEGLIDATRWSPEMLSTPPSLYVDGEAVQIYNWAVADTPDGVREASRAGLLAMTPAQAEARFAAGEALTEFETNPSELSELKLFKAKIKLEEALSAGIGETALSVLEAWHAREKQKPTTWKKHKQYVTEFSTFHKGLALSQYTKRHVIDYVEDVQKRTKADGSPYSPTSIIKRLDSVRAMFSFAVSADLIPHNPASGVKAPKDQRPKSAQSWKSLTKPEIRNLLKTTNAVWSERRASKHPTRKHDLMVALRLLVWTGARPEEICQLRIEDIDQDQQSIQITNDGTEDEGQNRARFLKNENSVRQIPVHSSIWNDLAEHIAWLEGREKSPLLFPSFAPLPVKGNKSSVVSGRYSRPISREWTDNLRTEITTDPRKVLYSLRHSWAAESRRVGMPEHVRNSLMGHVNDNPHADRYGNDKEWLEVKRTYLEDMICA